jgi:hypothetical protein
MSWHGTAKSVITKGLVPTPLVMGWERSAKAAGGTSRYGGGSKWKETKHSPRSSATTLGLGLAKQAIS